MASFAIFDENFYRSSYPDVAAAIAAGVFGSGLEHFQTTGLQEGRVLVSPNYNEGTYLQRYPDVAAVVAAGGFSSGLSHYIQMGEAEGRSGIPSFDDAIGDTGSGRSTPQFSSGPGNPTDYNVPGNGGVNEWQQNFDGPWSATADVRFVNGQTTQTIPLTIVDEPGADAADGNDTLIWTISDSAAFGFSQET